MFKRICAFVFLLLLRFHGQRDCRQAFLAYQIGMLQRRLGNKKLIPSKAERESLLALGAKCDHEVDEILEVISPDTYRRWLRKSSVGKEPGQVGRKPITGEVLDLIRQFKRENPGWGLRRILGELKKLGLWVSHMTIQRLLAREFPESPSPTPSRRKPVIPWAQFLDMHLETTLGCDFFYKRVWSWRGPLQVAVLAFIHLGSRRVYLSAPTLSPNDAWLQQQVRNVAMWCQDEGIEPRFLIRDNDQIFARTSFDHAWEHVGERVLRTPFQAPNANSYTENWIGNFKRECLNHFFCVSLKQLDRICQSYREFHNQYRPHQGTGIGNRVLNKHFQPQNKGEVRCRALLGGLLKNYYRDSA